MHRWAGRPTRLRQAVFLLRRMLPATAAASSNPGCLRQPPSCPASHFTTPPPLTCTRCRLRLGARAPGAPAGIWTASPRCACLSAGWRLRGRQGQVGRCVRGCTSADSWLWVAGSRLQSGRPQRAARAAGATEPTARSFTDRSSQISWQHSSHAPEPMRKMVLGMSMDRSLPWYLQAHRQRGYQFDCDSSLVAWDRRIERFPDIA